MTDFIGVIKNLGQSAAIGLAKFELYSYSVIFSVSFFLHAVAFLQAGCSGSSHKKAKPGRKEFAKTDIYYRYIKPDYKDWFTLGDVLGRYFNDIVGFYIALLTRPVRFNMFIFKLFRMW